MLVAELDHGLQTVSAQIDQLLGDIPLLWLNAKLVPRACQQPADLRVVREIAEPRAGGAKRDCVDLRTGQRCGALGKERLNGRLLFLGEVEHVAAIVVHDDAPPLAGQVLALLAEPGRRRFFGRLSSWCTTTNETNNPKCGDGSTEQRAVHPAVPPSRQSRCAEYSSPGRR